MGRNRYILSTAAPPLQLHFEIPENVVRFLIKVRL
jgi:hypothetical protein